MNLPNLVCNVCGHESRASLITHIVKIHKMKMDDYRSAYPECIVQRSVHTPEQQAELNKKTSEWFKDPENYKRYYEKRSFPSEEKHWLNKGLTLEEAKQKVSEWQIANAKKQDNPITKAKISKRVSGKKNPMSIESIMGRYDVDRKTAKQMTPCHGRTKEKHPMFGKKHTDESLEKIANAWHLNDPSYRSKAEIEIFEIISAISSTAKANCRFARYNVDSLDAEKKIVIEYFGDMWHMNPAKWKPNDKHPIFSKITYAKDIWAKDEIKVNAIKAAGYEVIVVWESDWKNDRESQIERIKNAYDKTL